MSVQNHLRRYFLILLILLYLSPASSRQNKANKGANYVHDRSGNEYPYADKQCSYQDCHEGGCRFQNCGKIKFEQNEVESFTHCSGGMCEFIDTLNPTCAGGACTFIRCYGASCDGGGCHHIHPKDTLKERYCNGGGCKLNGESIPTTSRNNLSR